MTRLSTLFGSGSAVGDIEFFMEVTPLIVKADGAVWQKTGVASAVAASYPIAADINRLKVFGNIAALAASGAITGIATNGSGTYVVAYGSTNVQTSTNNGATWATAAVGAGNIVDVCWTGARFIAVSNTTTAINCAYSTNGTSWTAAGGTAAVTSAVADTARIAHNGTLAVIACSSSAASANLAATTADGSTLTAKSLGATVNAAAQNSICIVNTNRHLIAYGATGSYFLGSDASAATLNTQTGPVAMAAGIHVVGNGTIAMVVDRASATYYTSTTGATGSWTARTLQGFGAYWPAGLNFGARPYWTGTYWICGLQQTSLGSNAAMMYNANATDGTGWVKAGLPAGFTGATSAYIMTGAGTRFVGVPNASGTAVVYAADFPANADFVGIIPATYAGPAGGEINAYVRIA